MLNPIKETKDNSNLVTIIACTVTALFALAIILVWEGTHKLLTEQVDITTTLKELCNAFTISGALVLSLGGLLWVSDRGAFDGFAFSMKTFFSVHFFMFNRHPEHEGETYADYVQRKHKQSKRKVNYTFQIFLGALLLIVGIIILIVYYEH